MKVGIIGGGNLGCVLATKFSQKHDVCLYTNLVDKVELYKKDMQVYTEDTDSYSTAKIKLITTSLKELCDFSEYIFITFPAFLFQQLANDLYPYLTKKHHLVFIPGSGGAELAFKKVIDKGVTVSGLQRVHSVARIMEFGKLTKESGIRKELKVASIPQSFNKEACSVISELYNLPVIPLDNYLNVTFVNSNPILHTSRLYSIFKDYVPGKTEYKYVPLFYEEWSLETSQLLIKMDHELFQMFDYFEKNGLPIKQIVPIVEHYESKDAEGLTAKIRSINSLKGLSTPSVKLDNGNYIPDLNSRYFTADFPFGLDILIAFAEHLQIECGILKMVSDWYHKITNTKANFCIENFGIFNEKRLFDLYK